MTMSNTKGVRIKILIHRRAKLKSARLGITIGRYIETLIVADQTANRLSTPNRK